MPIQTIRPRISRRVLVKVRRDVSNSNAIMPIDFSPTERLLRRWPPIGQFAAFAHVSWSAGDPDTASIRNGSGFQAFMSDRGDQGRAIRFEILPVSDLHLGRKLRSLGIVRAEGYRRSVGGNCIFVPL